MNHLNIMNKGVDPALDYELYEPGEEENERNKRLILEIYRDVKRVCDENKLCIMLAGGSCLGAIRHHGYIPWDDDMDCVMPRADYEEFKRIFEKNLGDKYLIEAPGIAGGVANNLFMKVILKDGPQKLEPEKIKAPGARGLWLDIVPMEYADDNVFKRILKGLACDALAYLVISNYLFRYRNSLARQISCASVKGAVKYYLRMALGAPLCFMSQSDWYALYDRFSRGKAPTKTVTFPAGIRHYLGEAHPIDVFLPPSQGEFEGETVRLPAKAHVYLRALYGADYMTPIPAKSRHLWAKRKGES